MAENTQPKVETTKPEHVHVPGETHAHPETAKPAKTEAKTAAPKAKAKEAKEAPAKTTNKPTKKKGVKAAWVKKEKVKKVDSAKDMIETLKGKWKPVFWGRFGKKNLRTRNNPKYDKWRKPRGEDMLLRKDDGMLVQTGYRTPKAYRGLHPSGYAEVMIYSKKDMDAMTPAQAGRFAATIGRKKRIEMIKYANTKKIHILN